MLQENASTDLDVRMDGIFDPIMFSSGQTGFSYSIWITKELWDKSFLIGKGQFFIKDKLAVRPPISYFFQSFYYPQYILQQPDF